MCKQKRADLCDALCLRETPFMKFTERLHGLVENEECTNEVVADFESNKRHWQTAALVKIWGSVSGTFLPATIVT